MLRTVVLLLLLANLLFFAWTRGWLEGVTGLKPDADREPQRLQRQVNPERVIILPPSAASEAGAAPAPRPAASVPAQLGACLEAGPFATGASVSAVATLQALQPPLPPGSWVEVTVERPGSWMVYLGRYPDREARAKKEEELRRSRVSFEAVTAPAEYAMGLSLGRFEDRAAAERALEQFGQRGVRGARVVELVAPATLHMLRADHADAALAERLSALRLPTLGRGFQPCEN
jgi:hypothetical protein